MAITPVSKDMSIISTLSQLPNSTDGLSYQQLQAKFDEGGVALKTYINDTLIPALESITDGSSGADQIGATSITDLTGNTVQALLESLKDLVDTQLPTPDGSITNAKLATDVKVGSLAALTTTDKSSVVAAVNEHLAENALNTNGLTQDAIRRMKDGEIVTIVCIGDSITFGQDSVTGLQSGTTYPAHLQTLLREYYQNSNITVINEGVSGNTTTQMIDRWQTDVTDNNPNLIIFMGGANDSREATAISIETYADNIKTIIGLAGETPLVVMGITPRFKEHETANGEGVIHFYRETCKSIVTKYGFVYVDMFEKIMNLYKNRGVVRGLVSPDGSHYTARGYKHLAEIVFVFGLSNDDLTIKPDEFKDIAGQWIVTTAAASRWGGMNLIDENGLVVEASSIKLYLYVEEFANSDLVTHFVIDNSNATDQNVDIKNNEFSDAVLTNFKTSPKTAGVDTFFINDYPVPVCKLKAGLNRVDFTTLTSVRMNGFSIIERPLFGYQEALYDSYNSTYFTKTYATLLGNSPHEFDVIGNNILSMGNGSNHKGDAGKLIPDTINTTRFRIRGIFNNSSDIIFGQQSNQTDYFRVYKLAFDGTNAVLSVINNTITSFTLATVALAVASTGTDLKIDIQSKSTEWSIWVNDTLIYTDTVPLSIGNLIITNSHATTRLLVNPLIKKGKNATDTGFLVGEEWTSFVDDKKHLVNASATEVTLTYA